MEEADNIQGEMGNASRELQILRKNPRGALDMRTTVREMKDGLISGMDMAEGRTSGCEGMTIDMSHSEKQRGKKRLGKKILEEHIQKLWNNSKGICKYNRTLRRRRQMEKEEMMTENFP